MKVQASDLMNNAGIAELTGLTRARVSQLMHYEDFPEPLETPGVVGVSLYARSEVKYWFERYRRSVAHKRSSKFGPKEE
jgi:predicted DNA-binding transcriptional regulator AlpA